MRKALTVAILVAGCSSSNVTGPGNSTGGAPASLVVVSGDGQTGAAGAALAADPAVEVKDSSGNPVSGVAVTFRIDSGGGTIAGGTTTTGSNGVATAGTWMLGPAAGRNTLLVSAGSLTPIRLGATATLSSTTILTTTTIGTGSGTFQDLDPGPLHGFSLATPAGAVSAPLALTISYGSATGVGGLQGLNAISPVITLSNPTVAYLQAPMTIHIPATVPSGSTPVVVMFNSATGARETLPTVDWDSTGVTALMSSLSTDNMTLEATGGSLDGLVSVQMTVISLSASQLAANYDSGFRPGTDGWEFPPTSTVVDTNSAHIGMVASSAWYFVAHPSSTRLFDRFQLAPDVQLSDRTGLRWTSLVSNQMKNSYFSAISEFATLFSSQAGVDQNQFNAVTAAMSMGLGGPQPQLVALYSSRSPTTFTPRLVLAYRKSGNTLSIYDPSAPGDNNRVITVDAQGMHPYVAGSGETYVAMAGLGLTALLPVSALNASYSAVAAGTVGNTEFGAYPLQLTSKYGPLGDTIWTSDTLRIWEQCAACVPVVTSQNALEATASLAAVTPWTFTLAGGTVNGLLDGVGVGAAGLVLNYDRTTVLPGQAVKGLVVGRDTPNGPNLGLVDWIDWVKLLFVKLGDTVITTPTPTAAGVQSTFTQQVTGSPLPPHIAYQWDFGDKTGTSQVVDNPATTHTYADTGIYLITGTLLDPVTKQPFATTHLLDTVKALTLVWQFGSATQTSYVPPPSYATAEDSIEFNDFNGFVQDLLANPAKWVFMVANAADIPGCQGIVLEQFGSPGAIVTSGLVEADERTVVAFSTQCIQSDTPDQGAFALGTIGSGTVVGNVTPITITDGNTTSVGVLGGSINARMTGDALQGTFTWIISYSTGYATYTFNFSGTQVHGGS